MPITLFHFGLGAALHGAAPRSVSFIAFCTANVLIDVESLVNLIQDRHPVHAFFHTYAGATIAALGTVGLLVALRALALRLRLPNLFSWRALGLRSVVVGALLGAWTHVLLDSVMHHDIRPLAPFSEANPLLAVLSVDSLHLLCVGLAVLGVALIGWRRLNS